MLQINILKKHHERWCYFSHCHFLVRILILSEVVSFDIFIEIEINSRDFFLQMFRIAVADAAARSYHNMSERLRLAGNLILFVPKS